MTTDFGLLATCHYQQVCRNLVVPGEVLCSTCRAAWGPLLREIPALEPAPAPVAMGRDTGRAEARRNQICWLCDQRRTCCRIARRWECAQCRPIT